MVEEHAKLKYEDKKGFLPILKKLRLSPLNFFIKSKIFKYLITFRPLLLTFLKRKGVPKDKVEHFIK